MKNQPMRVRAAMLSLILVPMLANAEPSAQASRADDVGLYSTTALQSPRNDAAAIAKEVIDLVDILAEHIPHKTFGRYLLPVKTSAAAVWVSAQVRGDLSDTVKLHLRNLVQSMQDADALINETLETRRLFDLGVRFLRVKDRLEWIMH